MNKWLSYFVVEVRKQDGSEYPPSTVHHLCSGIMRHVRNTTDPELDIYKDLAFREFRTTLDGVMKALQRKGKNARMQKGRQSL